MQRDFHYCTIKVLTQKAGFSPDEAQIIAYASEYVDDATDHLRFRVSGNLEIDHPRYDGEYFDPICTAHKGLQFVKSLNKTVQRKIYIPFHFIPSAEQSKQNNYDFCTRPGDYLARLLVLDSKKNIEQARAQERLKSLIALGIALHSFADSYSHQRFSGRHNPFDNDIENIKRYENGKWKALSLFADYEYNLLPSVGHAEALSLPDLPYLRWQYLHEATNEIVLRDNTTIFSEAAESIFLLLGGSEPLWWKEVLPRLKQIFAFVSDNREERMEQYPKFFPEIEFSYDEKLWREQAGSWNREQASNENHEKELPERQMQFKGDRKWFYFHIAALAQREFIMQRIPDF